MGGRVREYSDLFLLGRQIHDRVGDHVDESETAGQARRSHVADRQRDCVGTSLASELLNHLMRELDAMDKDPSRTERQSNSARTKGKL